MEPSQVVGGTEECNSSESGWTMYIASPMQDRSGDYNSDDTSEKEQNSDGGDDGNTSDSDDSMASDASSGPAHLETSHSKVKNGTESSKPDEEEEKEERAESDEEDARRSCKVAKGKKPERKRDRK